MTLDLYSLYQYKDNKEGFSVRPVLLPKMAFICQQQESWDDLTVNDPRR